MKKKGACEAGLAPASFLVSLLRSFVYADEEESDSTHEEQKADEQYHQLVDIHCYLSCLTAGMSGVASPTISAHP